MTDFRIKISASFNVEIPFCGLRKRSGVMRLSQTGPETNVFGELVTKPLADSLDQLLLFDKGYDIAKGFGADDAVWIRGPNSSGLLRMEVRPDVFLGIDSHANTRTAREQRRAKG